MMYNLVDLTDRRILITGASSGMGAETARLCSRLGAKVVMVARREEKLIEVEKTLEGSDHKYYVFDLSNVEQTEGFIKRIVSECGVFDGFVHSAGVGSTRPLKLLKYDTLRSIMDINYFSFVEIIRCITKRKCFNAGLSIIGISSIASKQGNQTKTAYSASKAAMDATVRCLAKELHKNNIRVNTVNPALINTDIYQQFLDNSGDSEDAAIIMKRQYMGLGETSDVANMIAYLLSDAAKFVSGANIMLDGGRLSS